MGPQDQLILKAPTPSHPEPQLYTDPNWILNQNGSGYEFDITTILVMLHPPRTIVPETVNGIASYTFTPRRNIYTIYIYIYFLYAYLVRMSTSRHKSHLSGAGPFHKDPGQMDSIQSNPQHTMVCQLPNRIFFPELAMNLAGLHTDQAGQLTSQICMHDCSLEIKYHPAELD